MYYFKYILFFWMCSFATYADQNDRRLDDLFHLLSHSYDDNEINRATVSIWEIWLETNDTLIESDFNQGLKLMQSGQLHKSIEMFTKVVENNPNFAEVWNKRATVYYLIGDFDSSILDIKETLILEPRHFGAMDGLGLIFIHLQEFEKAIDVYDQMLKILPHNNHTLQKRERLVDMVFKST